MADFLVGLIKVAMHVSTRYLLSKVLVHCTNKVWKHEINLNIIEVVY